MATENIGRRSTPDSPVNLDPPKPIESVPVGPKASPAARIVARERSAALLPEGGAGQGTNHVGAHRGQPEILRNGNEFHRRTQQEDGSDDLYEANEDQDDEPDRADESKDRAADDPASADDYPNGEDLEEDDHHVDDPSTGNDKAEVGTSSDLPNEEDGEAATQQDRAGQATEEAETSDPAEAADPLPTADAAQPGESPTGTSPLDGQEPAPDQGSENPSDGRSDSGTDPLDSTNGRTKTAAMTDGPAVSRDGVAGPAPLLVDDIASGAEPATDDAGSPGTEDNSDGRLSESPTDGTAPAEAQTVMEVEEPAQAGDEPGTGGADRCEQNPSAIKSGDTALEPIEPANDEAQASRSELMRENRPENMPEPIWDRICDGVEFNESREPYYAERGGANEVTLENGKRLDSYVPDEEIVSRKHTQLSEVQENTAMSYINEAERKYSPGETIAGTPGNHEKLPENLIGEEINGELVLEVPPQTHPIPQAALDHAAERGVSIRDTNGKVY